MKLSKKISVVVPVLNEAKVLAKFHDRLRRILEEHVEEFEIIFVDDGSSDSTIDQLRELSRKDFRVKIISFSRNFGHPMAISAGLDYVSGDAAIIIDADLQDPPEILPEFLHKWQEGYKVVYGVRSKRKEWFYKRLAYWLFYRMLSKLAPLHIPLDAGDFALLDRDIVNILKLLPERSRFVRGLRSWVGFRQYGVVYERAARQGGWTKYPFKKLLKLAADGIFSFSYIPLRLATILGFLVASTAFLAIVVILFSRLVYGVIGVPGFSSTIITVLFMGGIQLISMGILGEYIARIYEEVKNRPLYVIKEKIGL